MYGFLWQKNVVLMKSVPKSYQTRRAHNISNHVRELRMTPVKPAVEQMEPNRQRAAINDVRIFADPTRMSFTRLRLLCGWISGCRSWLMDVVWLVMQIQHSPVPVANSSSSKNPQVTFMLFKFLANLFSSLMWSSSNFVSSLDSMIAIHCLLC